MKTVEIIKRLLRIITISTIILLFYTSCDDACEHNNESDTENNDVVSVYKIGDAGPGGGIVFYDKGSDFDGWRYLEIAPNNIGLFNWSTSMIFTSDIGTAIGTGKSNTQRIIYSHPDDSDRNNAAMACAAYRGPNNLSDWFLPSKDELNALYERINFAGINISGSFWSSSQIGTNEAWYQSLTNGDQLNGNKSLLINVRAVRAF